MKSRIIISMATLLVCVAGAAQVTVARTDTRQVAEVQNTADRHYAVTRHDADAQHDTAARHDTSAQPDTEVQNTADRHYAVTRHDADAQHDTAARHDTDTSAQPDTEVQNTADRHYAVTRHDADAQHDTSAQHDTEVQNPAARHDTPAQRDSLARARQDSLERAERQLDSLRRGSVSLGTNLFYWGSSTPNAHIWFPVGDNITLGITGGIKAWPRWLPWDNDPKIDSKWRHFAIVPNVRWWPKYNYSGLFLGADLLWTHYNVGGVTFPLGLYPEVRENRLQGDFFGLGIALGYSWWLSKHLRLEVEAGVAAGYNTGNKYQCAWCGANLGQVSGPGIVPKLGLNLAYNFFNEKAARDKEEIETLDQTGTSQTGTGQTQSLTDTLKAPTPVEPPAEFMPATPTVEDWKGVAGQLEKDHPVLRPSSEYLPYTPERILRKESAPLCVFFELDKSRLLREFDEPTAKGSAAHRNNGPVLDEIIDITSKVLADTTSSVTKIQIIGLASVEGKPKHNQALSESRALALQHYMQERLPIGNEMFDTVGGGAAWTEFRDAINDLVLAGGGSGLTEEQLRVVLDLIDSEPDPAVRESRLKKLEFYPTLREYILADQRNSGYLRIYYDYVPDDGARSINEAIRLLEQKEYRAALNALEDLKEDPRSLNAYAVALFYNGREQEALDILRTAALTDESALENLRQLEGIMQQRAAYEQYLQEMEEYAKLKYDR